MLVLPKDALFHSIINMLSALMLSVLMLRVVLSVVLSSIFMLSFLMFCALMLSVIMLSAVELSVIMLNYLMLCGFMLIGIVQSVTLLNVVVPLNFVEKNVIRLVFTNLAYLMYLNYFLEAFERIKGHF
jgi:hypothetical protein